MVWLRGCEVCNFCVVVGGVGCKVNVGADGREVCVGDGGGNVQCCGEERGDEGNVVWRDGVGDGDGCVVFCGGD